MVDTGIDYYVGTSKIIKVKKAISKENCAHQEGYYIDPDPVRKKEDLRYIEFTYCPWCGTKLKEID